MLRLFNISLSSLHLKLLLFFSQQLECLQAYSIVNLLPIVRIHKTTNMFASFTDANTLVAVPFSSRRSKGRKNRGRRQSDEKWRRILETLKSDELGSISGTSLNTQRHPKPHRSVNHDVVNNNLPRSPFLYKQPTHVVPFRPVYKCEKNNVHEPPARIYSSSCTSNA